MTVEEDEALARELARQERESYLEFGESYYQIDESDDANSDGGEYSGGSNRNKKRKRAGPPPSRRQAPKIAKPPAGGKALLGKRTKDSEQAKESTGDVASPAGEHSGGEHLSRQGKTPQRWADDEHTRFLEGLELYGREWDKLASHVGTGRDKNAVKSHAQKHFIKLYIKNEPLPAKVIESGGGYTLSGKPLDPNSAALSAYLKSGSKQQQPAEAGLPPVAQDAAGVPPKPATYDEQSGKRRRAPAKKKVSPAASGSECDDDVPSGRTEYAASRLRSIPQQSGYLTLDQDASNPWMMVQCHKYSGTPGSRSRGSQPFVVRVSPSVLLVTDFHAHMARTEIIGFLAGQWDAKSKELSIEEAFPCRAVQSDGDDASTNVEMDPSAEVELRDDIRRRNLSVVGWYHSHPTFKPIPSNRDVENQSNYQVLMRDETTGLEPFIGLVVGPFDQQMPSEASVMNWFYVNRKGAVEKCIPMVLDVEVGSDDVAKFTSAISKLEFLVDMYSGFEHRVKNFSDVWRQSTAGGLAQGAADPSGVVTLREKLRASLKSRLTVGTAVDVDGKAEREARVDKTIEYMDSKWAV